MKRICRILQANFVVSAMCLLPLELSAQAVQTPRAAQLCVDLINQKRASIGVSPLSRWTEGESRAVQEALEDGRENTPHGAYRRRLASGVRETSAQNECSNDRSQTDEMILSCIASMWAEGPERHDGLTHGHYVNIANPAYTKVACGFALAPNGELWSVQDFVAEGSGAILPRSAGDAALSSEPMSPIEFDRVCVERTNRFRTVLRLPAYQPWGGGASCAASLASAYAAGSQPNSDQMGCLGSQSWGLSLCRSDGGSLREQLEGCVGRATGEGPGSASDPKHADYAYLASTSYTHTACGYVQAPNGVTTMVQIFK
ncbi:MAG: CAP domain-containing protein [Burkholderiaceae bacterium]|jgi:hypothetical protein